ncbi:hypothetical protein [Streptomyces roseolilacinus]|uniref:Uncharacterized protein n=1 Tax=Streptomyces roseolilacinus TaxID=66904 RepID=A0A918AYD9_9ACTN|nr:hypothetical protein [Streptomyces roseolilacinus]GGQ02086.1 hypothetical protein GCM10010249_20710 [Streptomyces roseolilacinus]
MSPTDTRTDTTPPAPARTAPGPAGETREQTVRRRWFTALVIVLLIGIPAGYLMISAEQSRSSGRDKEAESSVSGLQDSWPSKMKRRVFEVPIPARSRDVAYFETSNWKSSRLYVRFTTTGAGLDAFLGDSGTSRSALAAGDVTVGDRDAATVGWTFPPDRHWSGTTHRQDRPRPTRDITVDLTDPAAPRVYVVSTATP